MRTRISAVVIAVLGCAALAACWTPTRSEEARKVVDPRPWIATPSERGFVAPVTTVAGLAPPAQRSLRLIVPRFRIAPRPGPLAVVPFHLYRVPAIHPPVAVRPFVRRDSPPAWKAKPRMRPAPPGEMEI
jgi:hypothetical protein